MQCSQKVGQKKWSHNSSQKTSRTSTPTPPLLKGLLMAETQMNYQMKLESLQATHEKEIAELQKRHESAANETSIAA